MTTTATAAAALEITGLEAGYDGTTVLRGVSLTARAGEVTALLGPNGAGKTTLLRAVCGLTPATSGSVSIFGADVTRAAAHRRFSRGLCHVPEGRGVFRSLTVRENILMQAPKGARDEAVARTVEAFPALAPRLGQAAGTMSGGEQQMLALAAAYVRSPRLVLVDEASLGLAPIVVDRVFEHLHALAGRGVALLLVDQFAARVLAMAGSAYVLRRGRVVYSGSAADLLDADLFTRYTER